MILNRVKPSYYLLLLGVLWGIVAVRRTRYTAGTLANTLYKTCIGAAQNHKHLVAMRFLLGIFEAGFAPGCTFYLSSWYKKYELTSRFAWLYTSVAVAGALSGLLAGVITDYMDGAAGIRGWRWLFVSAISRLCSQVADHLRRSSKASHQYLRLSWSSSSFRTSQHRPKASS